MNTPVNFELAKLLKEKGFNEKSFGRYYTLNGKDWNFAETIEYFKLDDDINIGSKFTLLAPSIADVIMWLYEKHGVWVRVTPIPYSDNLTHWRWEHMSTNYSTRNFKWKKERDYMSPTEAYEAAIEYCLTKLI